MAPEIQPVLDPADHALMLTPDQIKNQNSKNNNVSFLRRTQYMTSQNARANEVLRSVNARVSKAINKSSAPTAQFARDDKENIVRYIQKGFDIAYPDSVPFNPPEAKAAPSTDAERDAWRNPVHPDNPRLKPVDYYPLLPDFDAYTDVGGYVSIKFDKPPLPSQHGKRDDRVDVALLSKEVNEALLPAWQSSKDAFDQNPQRYEDPGEPPVLWSYCVPETPDSAARIRRILNDADPEKDNPALWEGLNEHDAEKRIGYRRTKTYPVNRQEMVNSSRFMALALFNPDTTPEKTRRKSRAKGAYYYPVEQRLRMRADRGKLGRAAQAVDENSNDASFDVITLGVADQSASTMQARLWSKKERDRSFLPEYEKLTALVDEEQAKFAAEEAAAEAEAEAEEAGDDEDVTMGESETRRETNGFGRHNHHDSDHAEIDADADPDVDADADADADAMEDE